MTQQRGWTTRTPAPADAGGANRQGPDRLREADRERLEDLRRRDAQGTLNEYEKGALRALSYAGGAADQRAHEQQQIASYLAQQQGGQGQAGGQQQGGQGGGQQGDDQQVTRGDLRQLIREGLQQGGLQGDQGGQDDQPVTKGELKRIIAHEISKALLDLRDDTA